MSALPRREHGFAGITERLCPKPIVCACNGTAVAGGLEIALACDVIVAADHARFGLTEVKVGLLATSGGLVRLPKLIPAKIASEMCLTGNLINAQRAYEVGLVNHVVPKEQVMDKAMELAKRMAANAPIPMRLAKQILHMAPIPLWKTGCGCAATWPGSTWRAPKTPRRAPRLFWRSARPSGRAAESCWDGSPLLSGTGRQNN